MNATNIQIRESGPRDLEIIMEVESEAFGSKEEADLVVRLLDDPSAKPLLSLLAFCDGKAVGHILFTKAQIEGHPKNLQAHILAPLAVIPEYQRQGIGGLLIREGLSKLLDTGSELVFVLGHKEYYPRFGFMPDAAKHGFPAPYNIPAKHVDCWMVYVMGSGSVENITGRVICADELDKPELWRE